MCHETKLWKVVHLNYDCITKNVLNVCLYIKWAKYYYEISGQ